MKIDFHLHTRASFDCESNPVEIIDWAIKKGLDGMFVTEHDNTDGYNDLKAEADRHGITVLPGIEFTAARGTHYLVYLTPELPLPQDDLSMIMEIHRRGGLVGLPHPYRSDTGLIYNQTVNNLYVQTEIEQILAAVDFIEIVNAKSSPVENQMSIELADRYPHLKRIAGSDSHFPSTVGAAHTIVIGFQNGTIKQMAEQLRKFPFEIVTLPELTRSAAMSGVQSATEGIRRLMVKVKPAVPEFIWRIGKIVYRKSSNSFKERNASKSVVEKD